MRLKIRRLFRLSLIGLILTLVIMSLVFTLNGDHVLIVDNGSASQIHSRFEPIYVESKASLVYPSLLHYSDDRIEEQLRFIPPSVAKQKKEGGGAVSVKRILLLEGTDAWNKRLGSSAFREDDCPVSACELVEGKSWLQTADVVLMKDDFGGPTTERPAWQIWVLYMLEAPRRNIKLSDWSTVNWTATYRHDSTIVTPYEKYVPLNASLLVRNPVKNFAQGKTKKVAWFVSNCNAQNNRSEYAEELAQYIQVDIYGNCGTLQCPRSDEDECFALLNRDYKFYLAFENSNCRDYITEKFFINGLKQDVIPIVMGAPPEDYRRVAPPRSFIHVDDFGSPRELASYLMALDRDDSLYNEYFAWKGLWTNINTRFWCRLCALSHDVERRGRSWFADVDRWWNGPGVCLGRKSHWTDAVHVPHVIGDLAVEVAAP